MDTSRLWNGAPAATRGLVCAHLVGSLLAMVIPSALQLCALSPFSVGHGRIFPLVSYWVMSPSSSNPVLGLLVVALSTWVALTQLQQYEREQGTLRFSWLFFVTTTTCGIAYLVLALLQLMLVPSSSMVPCMGLWSPLLFFFTRRSLEAATTSEVALGPVRISAPWYPIALIGFWSALSMQLQLDLLAAWMMAIAAHHADGGAPVHEKLSFLKVPLHRVLMTQPRAACFEDRVDLEGRAVGSTCKAGGCVARAMLCLRYCEAAALRSLARNCPRMFWASYIPARAATHGESLCGEAAPPRSSGGFVAFGGQGHKLGMGDGLPASEP